MFNPKRLVLARKRRRLTAKALAEGAKLAANTVTRLEQGLHEPDETTVQQLATFLNYPFSFFFDVDPVDINAAAVSFRSFSKMSAKERDAAVSAGSLGLQLSAWIEERFSLPPVALIDLSYETNADVAAQILRHAWGIGERPIGDMMGLLEAHGIRVLSLSENTASVNAFSFWRDDRPFVFLNNFKTAESSIFDMAHELGHLIMHRHGPPSETRSAEREADSFASTFLMPEADVRSRMPRHLSVDLIIQAKKRWRVSAMAMAYRLRSLNLLSLHQYKSICIELTRRGYRAGEPDGILRETSLIWKKILAQLWNERTTKQEIADELSLPLDELEGLIWNLAAVSERPINRPLPQLAFG